MTTQPTNFFNCADGKPHDFSYRRDWQVYTCQSCGLRVSKDRLKRETDGAPPTNVVR